MMHMTQMLDTLTALRVPREHVRPLHLPDARRWLANGNPVVALINYGRLPRSIRATDYAGNHYVILVGYEPDGAFWVHDPLWPGQEGAYQRWTDAQLGEAWADPIAAMPLQGIVVQRRFRSRATTADVPLVVDVAGQQAAVTAPTARRDGIAPGCWRSVRSCAGADSGVEGGIEILDKRQRFLLSCQLGSQIYAAPPLVQIAAGPLRPRRPRPWALALGPPGGQNELELTAARSWSHSSRVIRISPVSAL